jgi:hypothetical protein
MLLYWKLVGLFVQQEVSESQARLACTTTTTTTILVVVEVSTLIEAARFAESNDHAWRVIVEVAVAHLKGTPCYQFWLERSKEQEVNRLFLEASSGVLPSPASSDTDVDSVEEAIKCVPIPFCGWLVGWLVGLEKDIHSAMQSVSSIRQIHSFNHPSLSFLLK